MRAEIFILSLFLLCSQSKGDICKHHLHSLATAQQFFVSCSTMNAVPVEICINCKPHYDNMTDAYDLVVKECYKTYIDNDRLNIISTTQSILIGLWTKAYCDDCFANNNYYVFQDKYNLFNDCVNKASQGDVCKGCLPAYKVLNDFYTNLDQHNNFKVCYDIQDKMNRTRYDWSNTHKCCHRTFDLTLFISASSFCAVVPLLFYAGMFLHGKRRERNHGVLDADAEDSALLVSEEITSPQQYPIVAPTPILVPTSTKSMNVESDSEDSTSDYGANNKTL